MIYYAKIKVFNDGQPPFFVQSVKTFGSTEENAKYNAETMLQSWQAIKNYEIIKISRQPIHLIKFVVSVFFQYNNGSTKTLKFNINAESKDEAIEISKQIIEGWRHLSAYHIINVSKHH